MAIDIRDQITFANSSNPVAGNDTAIQVQNEPTPAPVIEAEGATAKTQDDDSQVSPPLEVKDDQPKTKEGEEARKSGVERKIDKEVARRKEAEERAIKAEQRIRELEAMSQKKSDVDLDSMNFDDRVAYVAKEQAQQMLIESEKNKAYQEIQESKSLNWQSQLEEASSIHKDFYQVVESAKPIFDSIPVQAQEAVAQLKDGALIAYEIAKNPDLAMELRQATNPVAQATILLTLQNKVASYKNNAVAPTQNVAPIVQAKPTPNPQKNGVAPVAHHSQLDMGDFIARRYANGTLKR